MKKKNNILSFRILPQPNIRNWVIGIVSLIIFSNVINAQWTTNPEEKLKILSGCINQVLVPSDNGSTKIIGQTSSNLIVGNELNNREDQFTNILMRNCLGDLNMDDTVNILDLVFCIVLIMGLHEPSPYWQWAADLNTDGILDIVDVLIFSEWILENYQCES